MLRAERPHQRWHMDFVISDGRRLRALTIVGAFSRLPPGIEVARSLPAWVRVLNRAQIAAVDTCVRGSWSNKASAVSRKEVVSDKKNLAECCPCAQASTSSVTAASRSSADSKAREMNFAPADHDHTVPPCAR